jgi:SNF2 family DNA or RNA helicase
MYSLREVRLTKDQERIYNDLKKSATAELEKEGAHVTALSVISRLIRLHQVLCGHVRDENNDLHEIKERRTEQLLEVLQETDGKAIIWCSYDYNVREVARAIALEYDPTCVYLDEETGKECISEPVFPNQYVARFWGGNATTRETEEENFQTNPECRFIVGTPSAGGRGRLWVAADLVVYYSNRNDLEHRSQSEERAQGIDKVKSVAYVDLVVPGTVDEKIIYALRDKIDMAATISGDNWKEWLV